MFSYGFYNSMNGDRVYDAVQISSIFDGIIDDGVYSNVGEFFAVVPGTDMGVIVKTGRAWFDHTWNMNDSHLPLDIDQADLLQTRIDAVVLEVDSRIEKRENSIKIVKGTPSVNPAKPTLSHNGGIFQHALAYVTVKPGAAAITNEDIEIVVGKDETPFVQCPLKTVSIEDLFNQWEAEFDTWFDNLKATMTDNVVANLQRQIDEKVNLDDKATDVDILNGTPDKWVDSEKLLPLQIRNADIKLSFRNLEKETNGEYVALDARVVTKGTYPKLDATHRFFSRVAPPFYLDSVVSHYKMGYCYSKYCGVGEYDYVMSTGQLVKINAKTKAVVATGPSTSFNSYYVDDEFIVARQADNILRLYDLNLREIKTLTIPATGGRFTYVTYIYVTKNKTIIIAGTDSATSGTYGGKFWMFYSPPPYSYLFASTFSAEPNKSYFGFTINSDPGVHYDRQKGISFGLIQEDDSGTLYLQPSAPPTGSSVISNVYKSSDNGVTWSVMYAMAGELARSRLAVCGDRIIRVVEVASTSVKIEELNKSTNAFVLKLTIPWSKYQLIFSGNGTLSNPPSGLNRTPFIYYDEAGDRLLFTSNNGPEYLLVYLNTYEVRNQAFASLYGKVANTNHIYMSTIVYPYLIGYIMGENITGDDVYSSYTKEVLGLDGAAEPYGIWVMNIEDASPKPIIFAIRDFKGAVTEPAGFSTSIKGSLNGLYIPQLDVGTSTDPTRPPNTVLCIDLNKYVLDLLPNGYVKVK